MRQIEERWWNVGFAVEEETVPRSVDGNGDVDTMQLTVLVLVHDGADGRHTIRVPFEPETKQRLVRLLTGGVVLPPHLPFGGGV